MKRLLVACGICIVIGSLFAQPLQDTMLQKGREAYQSGNYGNAISIYRKYLQLAQDRKDSSAMADAYRLIGDAFRASGEHAAAMEQLEEGLSIAQATSDSTLIGRVLDRLAAVYFEVNDMKRAEATANTAMTISKMVQDQSTLSSALNILGAVYRTLGESKKALNALNESVAIQRAMGDTLDIPNALNNIANTLLRMGKYTAAIDTALRSYDMATNTKIIVYKQYAAFIIYKSYQGNGDLAKAIEWLEIYSGLTEEMMSEAKGKEVSKLRMEMNAAAKEQENQRLKAENALQLQTIDAARSRNIAFGAIGALVLGMLIILTLVARRQKNVNAALREKNLRIEYQTKEISVMNGRLQTFANEQEIQKVRLQDINKVKDKLFSIISHDLRSPLNSIQGMLLLLSEGMLSEQEFVVMADTLKTRVDHTTMLLDNLLNWSRSQMEGFAVQPVPLEIADLVANECKLLDAGAKTKGLTMTHDIATAMVAIGDKDMIQLVLRNLISNAIKFTEEGGSVRLWAELVGDRVHVAVSDNGIGIPSAQLQQVLGMEYFTTPGTANEKGSGLGLRLCREFLSKNNGSLWATPNADRGTTFWFSLPAA